MSVLTVNLSTVVSCISGLIVGISNRRFAFSDKVLVLISVT